MRAWKCWTIDIKMCDAERKLRHHPDFAHGLHIHLVQPGYLPAVTNPEHGYTIAED